MLKKCPRVIVIVEQIGAGLNAKVPIFAYFYNNRFGNIFCRVRKENIRDGK